MKAIRHHRTILLLLFLFLIAAVVFNFSTEKGTTQDLSSSPLPLVPSIRERLIAQTFASVLENLHMSQRALDAQTSKEAFRLYIKSLDSRKLFFYQSDIDNFKKKYESRFCEMIKQSPVDVRPAFEIYNLYLTRLKERVAMTQQILDSPIDFTVDEEYVLDNAHEFTLDENVVRVKGLQSFPKTPEEAYDRWRKRVKNELLIMKSSIIVSKRKQEKALAEGKEPEEIDERDPVERLRTRDMSLQRRMCFEGHIESVDLLKNIRKQANDDVMELFLNAIAGALDPHSSYMSPASMDTFRMSMNKNFQGIGATLMAEDGYITVVEVMSGSPAEKSGVHAKDKIQGVGQGKDGRIEEVIDFKVTDVVQLIRGEKGTIVRLDILPGGKGPSKIVEITRDEISLEDKAAKGEIFESGSKADGTPYKIGFIELPDFYRDDAAERRRDAEIRGAASDIKKILGLFVQENVDAVVLDLRYNGGGLLAEAIDVTGLFTGQGAVVQVKDDKSGRPQVRNHNDTGCAWTGPFVVVTNKFSASASEIFSGAIKDYRRGLVVGDITSLGKGTVQSLIDLNDRLLVSGEPMGIGKITIQGFYRPSGISTQKIGVEADIVLPSVTDVLENITEAELDNPLTLQKVESAPNFQPKSFVMPQMTAELRRLSSERIKKDKDFVRDIEKIAAYNEIKAKRTTPLSEVKYMEEIDRFNTDEWEREELEEVINKDNTIERDYYIDEVLAITVDYVKAMQESGIQFPKERTIPSQPIRRGLFSGFGL